MYLILLRGNNAAKLMHQTIYSYFAITHENNSFSL